jgi:heavy metal translocating P-type ATPase
MLVLSVAIGLHLLLRFATNLGEQTTHGMRWQDVPLLVALLTCGLPQVVTLLKKLLHGDFGSDLVAGVSIATAIALDEYLAATLVSLMLASGELLESYAVKSASSVLDALAKRLPAIAHRRHDGTHSDIPLGDVQVGDELIIFPHEAAPVDGTVIAGHSVMDESYLTGEPFRMSKTPGASVISGAVNGEGALTIRCDRLPVDSRYAKIMRVMRASEQQRPRMRRLADKLGAFYTPLAICIGLLAWLLTGDAKRFLAVVVVATPCPLLIGIPVAILGAISLAARRSIVIRNPAVLEQIDHCRVAIFDKTGTLTYGEPKLDEMLPLGELSVIEALRYVASLESYSKHPLAGAIRDAAVERKLILEEASQVSERPGEGMRGIVKGHAVRVAGRKQIQQEFPAEAAKLPPQAAGLECVVLVDNQPAGLFRFRDQPRREGFDFIEHLRPNHQFERVLLVSGDREAEVRYLADLVGIHEVHAEQSPEQKLELVRRETALAKTLFLGDGINDAPAMTAATVGIAFGQSNDVAGEAAGAVILDTSLVRVDELFHVARHLRRIALRSAVGGIAISTIAMLFAAFGYIPPVMGALLQEVVDLLSVASALQAAIPPRNLSDVPNTK